MIKRFFLKNLNLYKNIYLNFSTRYYLNIRNFIMQFIITDIINNKFYLKIKHIIEICNNYNLIYYNYKIYLLQYNNI